MNRRPHWWRPAAPGPPSTSSGQAFRGGVVACSRSRAPGRHQGKSLIRQVLAATLLLALIACHERAGDANPFGLRSVRLSVAGKALQAEVAKTAEQARTGLMFRDALPADAGMLFVYSSPRQASYWMKNTKIPLSIAFIDSQGTILEIRSMKPFDETGITSASDRVAFALEVNEGWFERNGARPGDKVSGLPRN